MVKTVDVNKVLLTLWLSQRCAERYACVLRGNRYSVVSDFVFWAARYPLVWAQALLQVLILVTGLTWIDPLAK